MKSDSDNVHPDVQVYRDELARDENAFWMWQDAANRLTLLSDFSEHYSKKADCGVDGYKDESHFHDAVGNAEHPLVPFPKGEAQNCVCAWLESCQEPLDLVERSIAKGHYQVPQEYLFTADAMEGYSAIARGVARLKTVQCSFYLHNGEVALAAKSLSDLLEMSRMTVRGDGHLMAYVIAMSVHMIAMEAVNAFAFHPNAPHDTLRDIRRLVLETRPATDSLARAFRVEVVYFTQHEVSRLPQTNDLGELVDRLVKQYLLLNSDDPNAVSSNDEQIDRVRNGMLKLLEGHPRPFDPAETVRLYSGVVAAMLSDLSSPWLERKKELASTWLAEVERWPQPLWFISDLSFSLLGKEKSERLVIDEEIRRARKALRKVHNPVGKQMLHYLDSFEGVRRTYHIGRLRTDAALLLIACRLFRDEEKRLPHQLSELVDANLVDSVPLDPFSGHPIRYDSKRSLIWSFGFDEEDNGGDWDTDFVWRVSASQPAGFWKWPDYVRMAADYVLRFFTSDRRNDNLL